MPPQFEVKKIFPPRGNLQLHRLVKCVSFKCNRCSLAKTSKLVVMVNDKWDEPVCNGCYGYLLSAGENWSHAAWYLCLALGCAVEMKACGKIMVIWLLCAHQAMQSLCSEPWRRVFSVRNHFDKGRNQCWDKFAAEPPLFIAEGCWIPFLSVRGPSGWFRLVLGSN